jgi:hypothetical protein
MILREYLITHLGKIARIGCERGSGFLFADRIGINVPPKVKRLMERKICSISPSVYGGDIVLIDGDEYGSEWLSKSLENPPTDIVPDEMYIRAADRICGMLVECLWIEMAKTKSAVYEAKRMDAWNMVDYYRAAILSPQFATLCPHADPEDILILLEKKYEKQFGEDFWERKPCTQTDS